jgi:hypothetical protein
MNTNINNINKQAMKLAWLLLKALNTIIVSAITVFTIILMYDLVSYLIAHSHF